MPPLAQAWPAYVVLGACCLLLYVRSVRYGLIWDDPAWYEQSTGHSLWATLTSLDTYQFYRPLAILLNRCLVASDGVVRHQLAHIIQISAHLFTTLLLPAVLLRLGAACPAAFAGALFFCVHPFAAQAVAWQAPQQPVAMLLVVMAYLLAERRAESGSGWALGTALGCYACALLFQESALPFVLLLVAPSLRAMAKFRTWRCGLEAAAFGLLALGYALLWMHVPRKGDVTGQGLDPRVLAYLLQGVVFPVASAVAKMPVDLSPWGSSALYGLAVLALMIPCFGQQRFTSVVSLALVALGIAPVWFGLSWDYVRIGSRLAYPALLGTALLWGRWLGWGWTHRQWGARAVGAGAAAAIVVLALLQHASLDALHYIGAEHMDRTVSILKVHDGGRVLFVNYPDRMRLRQEPYRDGYWGLTFAPVSQALGDFGRTVGGVHVETRSRAVFAVGADDRSTWPYVIDMRGENTASRELYEDVAWADGVYITQYNTSGQLDLRHIGAVMPADDRAPMATIGSVAELVAFKVNTPDADEEPIWVEMRLRPGPDPKPGDTLFVHLLTIERALVAGSDGDLLAGTLPLEVCRVQDAVVDKRSLGSVGLPSGRYLVTMGAYNRESGNRYKARDAAGERYWDDEVVLATVDLP